MESLWKEPRVAVCTEAAFAKLVRTYKNGGYSLPGLLATFDITLGRAGNTVQIRSCLQPICHYQIQFRLIFEVQHTNYKNCYLSLSKLRRSIPSDCLIPSRHTTTLQNAWYLFLSLAAASWSSHILSWALLAGPWTTPCTSKWIEGPMQDSGTLCRQTWKGSCKLENCFHEKLCMVFRVHEDLG